MSAPVPDGETWPCANYVAPLTCLTAPSSETGRCDHCREYAQRGLYAKYTVHRTEDPTGKHDECDYFVLDPQHDLIARQALGFYANQARRFGYESLADDLRAWVDRTDPNTTPFPGPEPAPGPSYDAAPDQDES